LDESVILDAIHAGYEYYSEDNRSPGATGEESGSDQGRRRDPQSRSGPAGRRAVEGGQEIADAIQQPDKATREAGISLLKGEVVARMAPDFPEQQSALSEAVEKVVKEAIRTLILEKGIRPDGRTPDEIREITCEVGVLPRVHGSGLFTRGQTQVISSLTLGSLDDAQIVDTLEEDGVKRYMHYYNFPPYSVGETRPLRGPGRREIGHGALAEKALFARDSVTGGLPVRTVDDLGCARIKRFDIDGKHVWKHPRTNGCRSKDQSAGRRCGNGVS